MLSDDVKLFNNIMIDLFPDVNAEPISHDTLMKILKSNISRMKLEFSHVFAERIIQVKCDLSWNNMLINFNDGLNFKDL